MKRISFFLTIIFALVLTCQPCFSETKAENKLQAGTVVLFGKYEKDNKLENGPEPIEWVILDIKDNKALLVTTQAIDCLAFNTDNSY